MTDLKEPMLKKDEDHLVHQPGRKRRASAMTRLIGYISVRKGNPQPSIIVSVMSLAANPGIDHLRRTLHARLMEMPRFRSRLVFEKKPLHWEEVNVDVGYHFEVFGFGRKTTQAELETLVASMRTRYWDLNRPLWRIVHVPEMEDGTSKVVIGVSHAVGDGISLVNALLFKIIDEAKELSEKSDEAAVSRRTKKPNLSLSRKVRAYLWGIYAGHTGAFWSQDKPSPLKLIGHPSPVKSVASSKKIELSRIKEVAKKIGDDVTINDVIMATFTKTMAMYMRDVAKEDSAKIKSRKMRVQFVFDARKKKTKATEFADPNNRFGLSLFSLPMTDFEQTGDLVREVKRRIDIVKCSPQPMIAAKTPERILPVVPTTTAVDIAFNATNIATCMLSNVPGPQQAVHLAGALLENMEFYLFSTVGVYFGIFSYNGTVSATANVDERVGADCHDLVNLFPVAFEEIYQGVCGPEATSGKEEVPTSQPAQTVGSSAATSQ